MAKWAFGSQFVQQGFRLFEDLLVEGGITQKVRKTALDFGFCKHKTLLETKMETPPTCGINPIRSEYSRTMSYAREDDSSFNPLF